MQTNSLTYAASSRTCSSKTRTCCSTTSRRHEVQSDESIEMSCSRCYPRYPWFVYVRAPKVAPKLTLTLMELLCTSRIVPISDGKFKQGIETVVPVVEDSAGSGGADDDGAIVSEPDPHVIAMPDYASPSTSITFDLFDCGSALLVDKPSLKMSLFC